MRRWLKILYNIILYCLALIGLAVVVFGIFFYSPTQSTTDAPAVTTQPKKESILVPTNTLIPSSTLAPTSTPVPTNTFTPTSVPKPTTTPIGTPTATAMTGITLGNANLRTGPDTSYPISGTIAPGQSLTIINKNEAGDWYQLDNKVWIAAFLVDVDSQVTQSSAATPTRINIRNDIVGKTYIVNLADIYSAIQDSLNLLSTRFSQTDANPSIMFTNAWQNDVTASLTVIKASTPLIRQLKPPSYLFDINNDFLQMANHLDKAVDFISQALDTQSSEKLTMGGQEIRLATPFMISAKEKLDILATQIDK